MEPYKRPSGLGRGLAALLGDSSVPAATPAAPAPPRTLPVAGLHPNPGQPRRAFDDDAMAELIESVRVRGVLQPLLVRPRPEGGHEIVAGERRWRAAQAARLHEVPAVILDLDDRSTYEVALIENIQRADLNPVEEAEAYQRLVADYGHTQEALATVVGKSRSHVANLLRLAGLPPVLRAHLAEGRLSTGHMKVILGAPEADREALAAKVAKGGLSVRQTEALLAGDAPKTPREPRPNAVLATNVRDADLVQLEATLADRVGLPVTLTASPSGGTVAIAWSNLEQLDGLIARLTK